MSKYNEERQSLLTEMFSQLNLEDVRANRTSSLKKGKDSFVVRFHDADGLNKKEPAVQAFAKAVADAGIDYGEMDATSDRIIFYHERRTLAKKVVEVLALF